MDQNCISSSGLIISETAIIMKLQINIKTFYKEQCSDTAKIKCGRIYEGGLKISRPNNENMNL
jgi:hypothetical protein